jgi:hypothetical protein
MPDFSEFDASAEDLLEDEGREMLEERVATLEWVLDHEDPNLTEEEQAAAEQRLEEFRAALETDGDDDA